MVWGLLSLVFVDPRHGEPAIRRVAPWYNEVNWRATLVSGIAFVIWAHAVIGEPPFFSWLDQFWAGLAALLFGAIAPKFVPAQAIGG
jgi:hypothetical protein